MLLVLPQIAAFVMLRLGQGQDLPRASGANGGEMHPLFDIQMVGRPGGEMMAGV